MKYDVNLSNYDEIKSWVDEDIKQFIRKQLGMLKPRYIPVAIPRCDKCKNDYYKRFYGWCECRSVIRLGI